MGFFRGEWGEEVCLGDFAIGMDFFDFYVSFPRLYQIYIQRTNISFGLLHLYRLGETGCLQVLGKTNGKYSRE